MKLNEVLSIELEKIKPSENEVLFLKKKSRELISSLEGEGLKAFVGGSLAKGTTVRSGFSQDIDIFVVFDYSEDTLKLGEVLRKISFPGELKSVHGSRDYFQIILDDIILEIIPVVRNNDPDLAENVTDVSLRHVKYIRNEISKKKELADEIRLAKAFCRAGRFYGAESYIQGFSGYSLELLVIYFGGFVSFLKKLPKIKEIDGRRVIDPMNYFRNGREVLREINSSKLLGPVVLVDPTHKYRNATAGLGKETFEKFLVTSKDFLKFPDSSYFELSQVDAAELKKIAKEGNFLFLEINLASDRQEGNVAGTKMKKFFDFFSDELQRKGQKIIRKEFDYSGKGQNAKGYLVVQERKEIEVRGPLKGLDDIVDKFKKAKGNGAFLKGKYWWFKEKVSVRDIFNNVKKVEAEMGAGGEII